MQLAIGFLVLCLVRDTVFKPTIIKDSMAVGAKGTIAPPIMFLEGHCPLKINQLHDPVLYLNFVL